ncbi:MAG: TetR/AcrR family transcriptional regulator [Agathobacter sp.]|nr:TetR/AcrR family transcriptional regulator [Agathobacter sp.]
MDLRTERTKRSIANAFLELRKQKPIEKITVKELAELAYINKATFYTHFHDIYDLADQMENEFMESVIQELPHPESIITDPALATRELSDALIAKSNITNILFSGSRQGYLSEKIYITLMNYITSKYPDQEFGLRKHIVLSIIIQGCFHAYQTFANDENRDEVTEILGEVGTCLKSNFL